MEVDEKYPALSALARGQSRPTSLRQVAERARPAGAPGFPALAECCRDVLDDAPRRGDCDAYGCLATLDAYVRKLKIDSPGRPALWSKISGDGRAFLDAVAGAAWMLQLWNIDLFALPDEPFPSPATARADVVLSLEGVPYWLDAQCVYFASDGGGGGLPQATRQELLDELTGLALGRYDRKFRQAVTGGPLERQSVGVLMCLIQPDDTVVRQLIAAPPPPALFGAETPGLDLVWVHNLCANRSSDILEPVTILEWMRPKAGD